MFIAFALEGVAMMLWLACREDPLLFVLLSGWCSLAGEIFSLFPSTLTDTFGSEHAASNYGWLYISQGIGSIFRRSAGGTALSVHPRLACGLQLRDWP